MPERLFEYTLTLLESPGDKYKIGTTISAIEAAYNQKETGLIIGHCKAIIESVCKSILDEKSIPYANDSNISWLARNAILSLGVASGVENEKKAREAFQKLITSFANHLDTATQAIGELRNDFCPIAHGKSISHIPLDMSYAEFVAKQTDAIIVFISDLHSSHKYLKAEILYQENEEFNEYLNETFGEINIYNDVYLSSDILHQMNKQKYEEALKEYNENKEDSEQS